MQIFALNGEIVIDTPPHTDSAACVAVEIADLVLIPCRPSALDLAAIQTNAKLVAGYGTSFCLVIIPRPTRRERRKQIAGFFSPEMSLAMHMLARRQGRSLQALMAEAFNDALRKYGESPIGD